MSADFTRMKSWQGDFGRGRLLIKCGNPRLGQETVGKIDLRNAVSDLWRQG